MTLVEVRSVSHARGVLRDVTVSFEAAELAVVAGRSGSGKSTLCHLIAGVMRPSDGEVLVAGKRPYPAPDWATVSLLPQRLALEPELSVAENVQLPASLRRVSPDPELLDRLGLAAIARALVLSPAVAVLDEPTAHQDDEHVHLVLDALRAVVAAGTLAVVATHDQRVIDIAGPVVRLASGRVLPFRETSEAP